MQLKKGNVYENVKYMIDSIRYIITEFGRRGPGDEGEIRAQEHMAEELRKYSDEVYLEKFKVRPAAFMGWIYISCTMLIASMVIYFFFPLASLIILGLGILPLIFEFILYKQFVDFLFPERESMNVFAKIKPTGELKRRIIINGHSDAAFEWHWHYKYGALGIKICIIGSLIGFLYNLGIVIATLATNGLPAPSLHEPVFLVLGIIQVVFLPIVLAMYWFSDNKTVVPGANDNLSAAYMGIALLKGLKENNIKLENTEVCCLITGSEEAGLRGAKVWAEKHKEEMNNCETAIIVYETLRDRNFMAIYDKDLNGTVKNNPSVCKLLKKAAEKNGKNLKYETVTIGSTDSAAFTQAGLKSAALAAMSPKPERYYHTRLDNYDNLSEECLELTYRITLDAIEIFDKEGLD